MTKVIDFIFDNKMSPALRHKFMSQLQRWDSDGRVNSFYDKSILTTMLGYAKEV